MSSRSRSSSTTRRAGQPERDRDLLAASISYARALRHLARYRDARDAAETYGGDLSALPPPPTFPEMEQRYAELLREVLPERVETASAEVCSLELIGAV